MSAAGPPGLVCDQCLYESWCPACHSLSKADYREYRNREAYTERIIKGALGGLLEERYTSIPQTTITLGVFFLCTGFQYVWLQLTKTPEECYENLLCETLGRRYNVKNWNAVLSNAVYLIVGGFLLVFIRVKARRDELKWRTKQRSEWEKLSAQRGGPGIQEAKEEMRRHLDERLSHNKASAGLAANACLALIFEGFLSGLYHACPTPTNTQFDYIGITMVSISFFIMVWCKRHPFAVSSGAYAVFFAFICLVITLDNVGFETGLRGFSTAAWVLTLTAWLILVPRFFMLLHFGIPNVLPNAHERARIWDLCRGRGGGGQERGSTPRWEGSGTASRERSTPEAGSRDLVRGQERASRPPPPPAAAAAGGGGGAAARGRDGDPSGSKQPAPSCWWTYGPLLGIWGFASLLLLHMFHDKENISRAIMKVSIVFLGLYTTWHLACLIGYYCRMGFSCVCCAYCTFCGQGKRGGPRHDAVIEHDGGDDGEGLPDQEEAAEEEQEGDEQDQEKVKIPAPVFLLIALTNAFGAAGIRFFTQDVYNTKKSMHESAGMNKECLLFGFFDNHDVWHLFSGLALGSYILTSILLDDVRGLETVF